MAKENGELLHVFNEYLNKQETKGLVPKDADEEQLRVYKYRQKMDANEEQLPNQDKYLDFQVMEKNENANENVLDVKLHNIRPEKLTDEERRKKMKNVLKAVKTESIEHGMLSIDDMMEWAMSTAVLDGASDEFMAIIIAMKGITEVFNNYAETWKNYEETAKKKKAGEASAEELDEAIELNRKATSKCQDKYYALAKSARKYVKSHDGVKWSDKGKNRLAFANYILSSKFMEKYVIKFSAEQLEGIEYPENLDADSFIMAYELQKGGVKIQSAVHDEIFDGRGRIREKLIGFRMDAEYRLPTRGLYDQVKMTASEAGVEEEKARVSNAITAYIGKRVTGVDERGNDIIEEVEVNKEPLFEIFDGVVEEVCNFKITEKMFTKKYYVDHPEAMIQLRRLSQLLGDCLDENGNVALGECGKEYLDLIRDNPAYTKFYAKYSFLMHVWFEITDFMHTAAGFSIESILDRSNKPGSVITHMQFKGAARADYEEEEYQLYTEELNRTPEEWMAEAVYMAKKDPHFTKEMKKYLNSSIYSAIKVPRRNNVNNR